MTPELNLERSLEELVQIKNKEIIKLDKAIFELNRNFSDLSFTLDADEELIPNIYSANLILKDIKKHQKTVFLLKEDFKKKKTNGYDSIIVENAKYSLKAQETYINFFFFNLDKDYKQIITSKDFLNGIYLVYAYNQITNAMANYDYKMQHQYSIHFSPIHQILVDNTRGDIMEKSRELLPEIKKILLDFYSKNKMIPTTYRSNIVLTPIGENSNWDGDTRTLSLNPESFWWCMENGKEKCMHVQALLVGGHEMGHATHERFSRILSKSLNAIDTNHSNLVSMPLTEYLAVNSSYKFLDFLEENSKRYNLRKKDIQLIRMDELNDAQRKLFKFWASFRKLDEPLSKKETEDFKIHKNYAYIINKKYNQEKKLSELLYLPSYLLGKNHFDYLIAKMEKEYGKRALNDFAVQRVINMGAFHPTVHKMWIDYALKGLGYEKKNGNGNHKA